MGWVVAGTLGCLLCFLQIGAMLSLLAQRLGFRWVAPLAFVAALLVCYGLARREGLSSFARWLPLVLVLGTVAGSLAISAFYFDLSWDGQWYHQTGIIHIASDWNPLTDPARTFAKSLQLWVRHYPKGPWYQAAAIYASTGHIEWGKSVQWIALAVMFLSSLAALRETGLGRTSSFALAVAVSMNPVVVSELTGFMVDGILIASLTAALAAMISAIRSPRPAVLVTACTACIMAINAKFTGLIFLGMFTTVVGVWCWYRYRNRVRRFAAIAGIVFVLGVLVWGYNPYVTNTRNWGQPFYPMLGSAKYPSLAQQGIDNIDRWETPRNIVPHNRLYRLVYAIFGRPGNQPYYIGKNATLMWPFLVHRDDLYAYHYQETRVAGFGPLFSGCLLLSLALTVWLMVKRRPGSWTMALACAAIITSVLSDRHFWWARYGPQLWWLPLAPLVLALLPGSTVRQRAFARTVLCILLINAAIVAGVRMKWETTHSILLRNQLRQMRASGQEYRVSTEYFTDSARVRLGEAGIRYQDVGRKKLQGQELMSVVEHYPEPIRFVAIGKGQ